MVENTMFIPNVKIIILNVNSLISHTKRFELQVFLQKHQTDFLLLSETMLNSIHKLAFKNYKILGNDRNNSFGGGTAILLKEKFYVLSVSSNLTRDSLEYTAGKINLSNNKKLVLVSVYNNNQNHSNFGDDMNSMVILMLDIRAGIIQ